MEELFSAKEVCAIFKISPSTLCRRVASGEFPHPRKIYPNGDNRWTTGDINGVFESMGVVQNGRYRGTAEQVARAS